MKELTSFSFQSRMGSAHSSLSRTVWSVQLRVRVTSIAPQMKNVVNPCVALIVPWPGQVRTRVIPRKVYWAYVRNAMLSHGVGDAP